MGIIQKAGGRSIIIRSTRVIVNGQELPIEEANKVVVEAYTKIKRKFSGVKPSPADGDNVVIVNSFSKK